MSPDRIKALDMQFMNELLSLITSTGSRMDYSQRANNSGCALMKLFNDDKDKGNTPYAQSPYYHQGVKMLLSDAMAKTMTRVSQKEFDLIRDTIEELNHQFPISEQLITAQRARAPLSATCIQTQVRLPPHGPHRGRIL